LLDQLPVFVKPYSKALRIWYLGVRRHRRSDWLRPRLTEISFLIGNARRLSQFTSLDKCVRPTASVDLIRSISSCHFNSSLSAYIVHEGRSSVAPATFISAKFMHRPSSQAFKLVQFLDKDGGDARDLIVVVLSQLCIAAAMLCAGPILTLIRRWKLSWLTSLSRQVTMGYQSRSVAKCEFRNKRACEEVATSYCDVRLSLSARGIDSETNLLLD